MGGRGWDLNHSCRKGLVRFHAVLFRRFCRQFETNDNRDARALFLAFALCNYDCCIGFKCVIHVYIHTYTHIFPKTCFPPEAILLLSNFRAQHEREFIFTRFVCANCCARNISTFTCFNLPTPSIEAIALPAMLSDYASGRLVP